MTNDSMPQRSGRLQLILVALVFLLPLAGAAILYYGGPRWHPGGHTNHGILLSPIVNVTERLPDARLGREVEDYWALVYIHESDCRDTCRDALYTLRQARLMLGKDMSRLKPVFLHGAGAPDTVFPDREHRGTVTLHEPAVASVLQSLRPDGSDTEGYFLLDPLGNVVMYFPPDIVPRNMLDDLSQLLELSRIG